MKRTEIIERVLDSDAIPLWVPLLTHYRFDGKAVVVDTERMARHMRCVRSSIRSWMIAGSTGDGWDISSEQFETLLASAARDDQRDGVRILIGVLRPTTDAVIAFIDRVHAAAGTSRKATLAENVTRLAEKGWVGITVCPPVGAEVTQDAILEHYRAVAEAARMPLAVYQLPQVTQNEIAPATMAGLVAEHEEIILFKDSSGTDTIARAAEGLDRVVLVRGAEGDYASVLKPLGGPYDGLLLSTGNVFGPQLRGLLDYVACGDMDAARSDDARLTAWVQELFAAGADAPVGNAFANVNRAIDHVFAHGGKWADCPAPLLFDGSSLPDRIVAKIAVILEEAALIPSPGYLSRSTTRKTGPSR